MKWLVMVAFLGLFRDWCRACESAPMKVAIIVSAHLPDDYQDDWIDEDVRELQSNTDYVIDAVQIVRLEEAETLMVVGKAIA